MMGTHFINVTCTSVSTICPVKDSIYGYEPSFGFNIFFAGFFAAFAILHAFLALRFRTYFFGYVLTVGCVSESIGYGGRLLLHKNAFHSTGFEMQISCLVFAPSFVAAGIYIYFKRIIDRLGRRTSRLSARLYVWIFILCDLLSLTLQAVGGGLAGSAGKDVRTRLTGTDLMLAGIVFQVFTMLIFSGLAMEYFFSIARASRPFTGKRKQEPIIAIATATICVLARCIYRIPELAGGWGNSIMRDQASFIVLEGFMIVIAVGILAIAHPGIYLPSAT